MFCKFDIRILLLRVPAPCQYAHKLAFLVGQSLHKQPNQELETLLYYL